MTNKNAKQKVYKVPYRLNSTILESMYYRIRDLDTGQIIIPFETTNDSTKLSSDKQGMYFNLRTEILPRDRDWETCFQE